MDWDDLEKFPSEQAFFFPANLWKGVGATSQPASIVRNPIMGRSNKWWVMQSHGCRNLIFVTSKSTAKTARKYPNKCEVSESPICSTEVLEGRCHVWLWEPDHPCFFHIPLLPKSAKCRSCSYRCTIYIYPYVYCRYNYHILDGSIYIYIITIGIYIYFTIYLLYVDGTSWIFQRFLPVFLVL